GVCAHGTDVEVIDAHGGLDDRARNWLQEAIVRAIGAMECAGEVRVRVVGDAEIARVHEEFLGQPGTTDVITFDMSEPDADAEGADGKRAPAGALTGLPGRVLD